MAFVSGMNMGCIAQETASRGRYLPASTFGQTGGVWPNKCKSGRQIRRQKETLLLAKGKDEGQMDFL